MSMAERATVIRGLCEGNSVRGIARQVGCQKNTVLRLLAEVGDFCAFYQNIVMRNLTLACVEADEAWGFCRTKDRNARLPGDGDLWTYNAVCSDSKLLFAWLIGPRSKYATRAFIRDLASRIEGRFQLSTDGLHYYEAAVRAVLAGRCDYGQVIKEFGTVAEPSNPSRRYSPAVCTRVSKISVMGVPDMDRVSTSYVERLNLTTRTGMKRMARLTLGFSKKEQNHCHAFAIHAMHYNFVRAHGTLSKKAGKPTTPAMAAGLTAQPWTVEDVLARMESLFVTR